jgi:hypothetical protein
MKDCKKKELEIDRPKAGTLYLLDFCLDQLYADKEHCLTECIVSGLSFEELIGTLLKARDFVKEKGNAKV